MSSVLYQLQHVVQRVQALMGINRITDERAIKHFFRRLSLTRMRIAGTRESPLIHHFTTGCKQVFNRFP